MWVEQAIFTSLARAGRSGYHVVARSPGLSESDVIALAAWSPSHGALIVDGSGRTSVNFHPMPGGRFGLSRTCEGRAEYSGRGGRQAYTHTLVFDAATLTKARNRPFALYRDALALGHFCYRAEPEPVLAPVELSSTHDVLEVESCAERARALGLVGIDALRARLIDGRDVRLAHPGDRAAAAECLLDHLPPEVIPLVSFATALHPSAVRPFRLTFVVAREPAVGAVRPDRSR